MADPTIKIRSSFCPSLYLAVFVIDGIGLRFAIYDPNEHAMHWLYA